PSIIRCSMCSVSSPLISLWLIVKVTAPLSIPFFFFQAEDGIRDRNVTGVQTCALPIYSSGRRRSAVSPPIVGWGEPPQPRPPPRSEERRVGKECRSRWGAYD